MNGGPVARLDNMSKKNGAAGPQGNKRGNNLVVPGEDLAIQKTLRPDMEYW